MNSNEKIVHLFVLLFRCFMNAMEVTGDITGNEKHFLFDIEFTALHFFIVELTYSLDHTKM